MNAEEHLRNILSNLNHKEHWDDGLRYAVEDAEEFITERDIQINEELPPVSSVRRLGFPHDGGGPRSCEPGPSPLGLTENLDGFGVCDPKVCDPKVCDPKVCDPKVCNPNVCDPRVCKKIP
jgi:hypothetical protein